MRLHAYFVADLLVEQALVYGTVAVNNFKAVITMPFMVVAKKIERSTLTSNSGMQHKPEPQT
jgi:hypothetical protein